MTLIFTLLFMTFSLSANADCDSLRFSLQPLAYFYTDFDPTGVNARIRASPTIEGRLQTIERASPDELSRLAEKLSVVELLTLTAWLHHPLSKPHLPPLIRTIEARIDRSTRESIVRAVLDQPLPQQIYSQSKLMQLEPALLTPLLHLAVLGTNSSSLERSYLKDEVEQRSGSTYPWAHGVYSSSALSLRALHHLFLSTDTRKFIDIGSGFGTTLLPLALLHPEISFVGFEFHPEKIRVSRERADVLKIPNVRFEKQDVGQSEFYLPDADIYYFYDSVSPTAAEHLLKSLEAKFRENKPFLVVIQRDFGQIIDKLGRFLAPSALTTVEPFGRVLQSLRMSAWKSSGSNNLGAVDVSLSVTRKSNIIQGEARGGDIATSYVNDEQR